jgi:hypothetical protein
MSESFDDFSKQYEGEDGQLDNSKLIAQAPALWKLLKEQVSKLDGKPFKGHSLVWLPNGSMLMLEEVVAAFEEHSDHNSLLHHYRVVFSRRPLGPAEFQLDELPIGQLIWDLEPKFQGGELLWHVDDLGKTLTAPDLSNEIAIQLAKYYLEYQEALGSIGFDNE